MEFHLFQNRKEYCHHDHIPLNLKKRKWISICSVWAVGLFANNQQRSYKLAENKDPINLLNASNGDDDDCVTGRFAHGKFAQNVPPKVRLG